MRRLLPFLLTWTLATAAMAAPSVRWNPPSGTLGHGQTSQLELIFEDCRPADDFELPTVSGLHFGRPSVSNQTSIINGAFSQVSSLVYPVRPTQRDPIVIPAFEAKTSAGPVRVAEARFVIGAATVGSSGLTLEQVVRAELIPAERTVWAGEVFPIEYRLLVAPQTNASAAGSLEWQPSVLAFEPWSGSENISVSTPRGPWDGVSLKSRGFISRPGSYTAPAAQLLINVSAGQQRPGFFTRPSMEQFMVSSNEPTFTVKPLPRPAPPEFQNAVGNFNLRSRLIPAAAEVGEPVTWTLELEGAGNWPAGISPPSRDVPQSFRVIQPKVQRNFPDGILFQGKVNEDVILVPTRSGSFTLGPVRFVYFDPADGEYKSTETQPVTLVITGAPIPSAPAAGGAPGTAAGPAGRASMPSPVIDTRPIPLDPIAGTAFGLAPWSTRSLTNLAWLALLPLLTWKLLALRKSWLTDPWRARRLRRADVETAVRAVAGTHTIETCKEALIRWQRATADFLGLDEAAPIGPRIAAAVAGLPRARNTERLGREWERLWTESDRVLYGPGAGLPEDWTLRAAAALRGTRLPGWNPLRVLKPSMWFPAFIAACLLAPVDLQADPVEAYRSGNFAEAEIGWRAAATEDPFDWIARHNLGLSLAQQERWAEAGGHWTAAFLQRPREATVRWDFNAGVVRTNSPEPLLRALAAGEGWPGWVGRLAPWEWQASAAFGSVLSAATISLWLLAAFLNWRTRWTRLFTVLLVAGVSQTAVSAAALRTYGPLTDPAAALTTTAQPLRSVPTDLDAPQQTRSLRPGTLVRIEHRFFGWIKIRMLDGQTGWLRETDLVPLYGPPPPTHVEP